MTRNHTPERSEMGDAEFPKGWTFEKALERLEKIVTEMETGKLPLEAMIGRFEEGQKLIEFCTRKLNEVERRIELLVKKGETAVPEPFEVQEVTESGNSDGESVQ